MPTDREVIDMLVGILTGGRGGHNPENPIIGIPSFGDAVREDRRRRRKKTRTPSASQKKYGRAFKRLAPKYKKKNGSWKKDGFKRCVRAAHRECRRKR
jgi:hypothetical protein